MGRELSKILTGWLLTITSFLGCISKEAIKRTTIENPPCTATQQVKKQDISYKLEDLVDTELLNKKSLTLNIFIERDDKVWEYHEYKEELFDYVKKFYKKHGVSCKLVFSGAHFVNFSSCNELGIEVLADVRKLVDRHYELCYNNKLKSSTTFSPEETTKGIALTELGISLINGSWEEWGSEKSRKDIEWYNNFDKEKGMTIKEYMLRIHAKNICHETLHCMGLFHPNEFDFALVETHRVEKKEQIPNALSYYAPNFKEGHPTGTTISVLQESLLHSFLAGNNAYKSFVDSGRDLDVFLERMAKANNLVYMPLP